MSTYFYTPDGHWCARYDTQERWLFAMAPDGVWDMRYQRTVSDISNFGRPCEAETQAKDGNVVKCCLPFPCPLHQPGVWSKARAAFRAVPGLSG